MNIFLLLTVKTGLKAQKWLINFFNLKKKDLSLSRRLKQVYLVDYSRVPKRIK